MNFTRAASLLTATALTATALTACGDGSEPTPSSSTASPIDRGTDSPSETSSGSETSGSDKVAELPEAATKRTKAGAIAFNEFYQLKMGEALKTGETQTLKEYSHVKCSVCANYIQRVDDRTARGIRMDINPNTVRDASAEPRSDNGYKVTLTVDAAEYHEILEDGSTGRSAAKVTYTVTTDTRWRDGHWVIRGSVLIK